MSFFSSLIFSCRYCSNVRGLFAALPLLWALPSYAVIPAELTNTRFSNSTLFQHSDAEGEKQDNRQLLSRFSLFNTSIESIQLNSTLAVDVHSQSSPDTLRLESLNLYHNLNQNFAFRLGRQQFNAPLNDLFQYSLSKNDQIRNEVRYSDGINLQHRLGILDQRFLVNYSEEQDEWYEHYQLRIGALGYGYGKINFDAEQEDKLTLSLYAQKAWRPIPGSFSWHFQHRRNYDADKTSAETINWQHSIIWRDFLSAILIPSVNHHDIGYLRKEENGMINSWLYQWYNPDGWTVRVQFDKSDIPANDLLTMSLQADF